MTWNKKVLIKELGQRTLDRGLLEGERDYSFLGLQEIYDLFDGKLSPALAKAKVAGRMKGFDAFLSHEEDPPMFLHDNEPMDLAVDGDNEGVVRGVGTSPATVTARADHSDAEGHQSAGERRYPRLPRHGLGLDTGVQSGQRRGGPDPGGAVAHFSCLSREYGIPAVSLPGAMKLIEDGSITT